MAVPGTEVASSEAASNTIEGGIRALVRRNRLTVAAETVEAEHCDDPLQAGTMSIADINKLMGELEMARNYLQSEGERVRQMMARYTHLAETASASVKIIAESLGKWRNSDKLPDLVMPHTSAPDLSPVDDDNAADGHEKTATSHG